MRARCSQKDVNQNRYSSRAEVTFALARCQEPVVSASIEWGEIETRRTLARPDRRRHCRRSGSARSWEALAVLEVLGSPSTRHASFSVTNLSASIGTTSRKISHQMLV